MILEVPSVLEFGGGCFSVLYKRITDVFSLFTMERTITTLQLEALAAFLKTEPGAMRQLGIVYVADVARVRRERAANRKNLEELWGEGVRRHCQNIDVFDLRYLFGYEIDPDWW
ncbi:uncharacterized protein LOC123989240 [Osmia bicornis bicornis]|uniref:uncharacterized protein LOC123989240 n=1 Tax=Osmia bicornis bicornis TaxID=1437191 RepID=UPI001EAF4C2D|nr:uncharacterized protein LOC123989240 [Osmia bicornis bicornis]